jgi:hypothetical protein
MMIFNLLSLSLNFRCVIYVLNYVLIVVDLLSPCGIKVAKNETLATLTLLSDTIRTRPVDV